MRDEEEAHPLWRDGFRPVDGRRRIRARTRCPGGARDWRNVVRVHASDVTREDEIEQGRRALERALSLRRPGPYQLQAAIASLHYEEPADWAQIALLYGRLAELTPTPVVELNRAVAVAMADGPEPGLEIVDRLTGLDTYHLWHSTRAELLHRLGREEEAAAAYSRALELAPSETERTFLQSRITA